MNVEAYLRVETACLQARKNITIENENSEFFIDSLKRLLGIFELTQR